MKQILIARCDPDARVNQNRSTDVCGLTKGRIYEIQEDSNVLMEDYVWVTNDYGRVIRTMKSRFSHFRKTTKEDLDKINKMTRG